MNLVRFHWKPSDLHEIRPWNHKTVVHTEPNSTEPAGPWPYASKCMHLLSRWKNSADVWYGETHEVFNVVNKRENSASTDW
jgi:hypothetical protein